jgi:hypothetical protein
MDKKRKASLRNMRQGRAQLLLRDHGEAVDAGVDEKTLEAGHPGIGERLDVVLIIGDDSAPGHPVDPALTVCGSAFGLE